MSADDDATARMLGSVFPGTRLGDVDYLHWLYRTSPAGDVVESNLDDDEGRAGHYAVVPCALADGRGPIRGALSLNTAVEERARGGGVFTRLARATYAAARERGIEMVVGVSNANSTHGMVHSLGFTLLGPLPVTVMLPMPGRGGLALHQQSAASLAGDGSLAQLLKVVGAGTDGLTRCWTPETLAWRLASPGAPYVVHRGDGLIVVSTTEQRGPLRVAVILALLADHVLDRRAIGAVVRATCRAHRAPAALHAGITPHPLRGVPLPVRLRPSPLNLIVLRLDDDNSPGSTTPVGRFEFLDFDAY